MPKAPKKDQKKQRPAALHETQKQSLAPKGLWKDHPHGSK